LFVSSAKKAHTHIPPPREWFPVLTLPAHIAHGFADFCRTGKEDLDNTYRG